MSRSSVNILNVLNTLFIDMEDVEPSVTFTYAALDELSRLVEILSKDEKETPINIMRAYLTIAGEYMSLKHYQFAREYYQKAFDIFPQCRKDLLKDEEETEFFADGCVDLLKIYSNTGNTQAMDSILDAIHDAMPDRYEDIRKQAMSKLHIKNDPVEYTDKYLAILPELETKIESRLKGIRRSMGFCFQYWRTKKEILKQDYGIEWDSPSILNPRVRFD